MARSYQIRRGSRVDFNRMLKRIGLCASVRKRKAPAKYLGNMTKHAVQLKQKKIAVYAYKWHRKAYVKRT